VSDVRHDSAIKRAGVAFEVLIFAQGQWYRHSRDCEFAKAGNVAGCPDCAEQFVSWKTAKAKYLERIKEMIG